MNSKIDFKKTTAESYQGKKLREYLLDVDSVAFNGSPIINGRYKITPNYKGTGTLLAERLEK